MPDLDFTVCSCGRPFATKDGYDSHFLALHDAEPNPQDNIPNDQHIRDEDAAAPAGANAPYKIRLRDGKWQVLNNTGAVKATFPSQPKALAYLRALYVNVKGAPKRAAGTKFTGKAKDRVPAPKGSS